MSLNCENDIKKILIIEPPVSNSKKVKCEKEKKLRVETNTWGLTDVELKHEYQLQSLNTFDINININEDKYKKLIKSHLKDKINSYKQQDIVKKRLNDAEFVSLKDTIDLLKNCEMKCAYCSEEVYILYEKVREKRQWSLDRINNDIGHNRGNLLIACLECNLKRRRTNKDAFFFTKNMVIIKDDK